VKLRLIMVLALIVLAPLLVLGWLAFRVALNERDAVQSRMREVLLGRLRDVGADIRALIEERERIVLAEGAILETDATQARPVVARSPLVRQYVIVGLDGPLEYPSPDGPLTEDEKAFLERTRSVWESGGFPRAGPVSRAAVFQDASNVAGPADATSTNRGWYVWYWGDGLNLIYWWRGSDGRMFGGEMNAARLTADIIGIMPEGAELGDRGRIVLRDSRGQRIHQWGAYAPPKGEQPAAALPLAWPLASWTLEHYASRDLLGGDYGRGVMMNLAVGLALLGLAVVALAVYYYRETAREMREAAQRVTFVNQVSHELKTPLTNIRMYAELLEDDLQLRLPNENGQVSRGLSVIVAESQRLSRLIGNVLTFGRQQRGALTLHQTVAAPDDVLRAVASRFKPALAARQINIVLDLAAARPARLDSDVLEQIAGNLLNNVEKYAVGATSVKISSTQEGDTLDIIIEDDGPGISPREAGKIFAAFYRVSNRLTDGVAGTGIGLTIARDLARLHGGDLTLETAGPGARFRIRMNAPLDPGAERLQ